MTRLNCELAAGPDHNSGAAKDSFRRQTQPPLPSLPVPLSKQFQNGQSQAAKTDQRP